MTPPCRQAARKKATLRCHVRSNLRTQLLELLAEQRSQQQGKQHQILEESRRCCQRARGRTPVTCRARRIVPPLPKAGPPLARRVRAPIPKTLLAKSGNRDASAIAIRINRIASLTRIHCSTVTATLSRRSSMVATDRCMSLEPRDVGGNALHHHCSEERLLVGKAGVDGRLPGAGKPRRSHPCWRRQAHVRERRDEPHRGCGCSTSPASSRGGRPVRTARPLRRLIAGVASLSIERSSRSLRTCTADQEKSTAAPLM